jgi:nitric oxide reductase NorQ protein
MTTTALDLAENSAFQAITSRMDTSDFEGIQSLFNGLPTLMLSTYAQHSSPELVAILDKYTNKGGRLTGRASVNTSEKKIVVEDLKIPQGEKSYLRPNGQAYYTRKWGEHDDVTVLRTAREQMQFTLLYGAPGCGKTALVEAAYGEELQTVLGSGDTEVADLVGGYTQDPTGGFHWIDGPLIKAAENGQPLLIDEVGLIDPKVLSIVYGLMDGRREYLVTANPERGTVKAKEGFYVVGATNPNAPGVRLSEALLSRFAIHVEMTSDFSLAKKLGVPVYIVTAAQNLAKKQASSEVSWAPQFRELLAFRDLEKIFGTKWALANLIASAPEMDRPVITDVIVRAHGEAILPARI